MWIVFFAGVAFGAVSVLAVLKILSWMADRSFKKAIASRDKTPAPSLQEIGKDSAEDERRLLAEISKPSTRHERNLRDHNYKISEVAKILGERREEVLLDGQFLKEIDTKSGKQGIECDEVDFWTKAGDSLYGAFVKEVRRAGYEVVVCHLVQADGKPTGWAFKVKNPDQEPTAESTTSAS